MKCSKCNTELIENYIGVSNPKTNGNMIYFCSDKCNIEFCSKVV